MGSHNDYGSGISCLKARDCRYVLGMRVDQTTYAEVAKEVCAAARSDVSAYICVATVNNVMEAYDSAEFRQIVNGAAIVTPDGMPLVWALKVLGLQGASRVYGPDLTPVVLGVCEREGIPVGFYGGTPETLRRLVSTIRQRFPRIRITYTVSPPFRSLTPQEDAEVVDGIIRSHARVLFVGLSTPKQERWMASHADRLGCVMLGVGAAFDFLAGTKRQAPRWMMRTGMEWFFRLATEPKRLWKRYLRHNPRFVVLFGLQLLGCRSSAASAPGRF